ncbi:hypothetical protein P3H15_53465 [Rhodococcus sp. T2V]|uniref:hypothetical protein n=1 Tax=Rhodococcus sp. T2V TaxID=3034164 RepID=UPI0023E1EBF8|nr:hypothetical protein [Rhodococcus sp. T2V]MDF3313691.1 hypothetical protein [Rhodococcus sp. T2V]
MTSTAAAVLAAERSVEGPLPVWLTLAVIALVLLGGYAATAPTAQPDRTGGAVHVRRDRNHSATHSIESTRSSDRTRGCGER